jgi:phosphoenolpyruvate carboxylase
VQSDPHQPLRDDVRTLGEVLGRVLRYHEGDELFAQVERVREAAKREPGWVRGAIGAVGAP